MGVQTLELVRLSLNEVTKRCRSGIIIEKNVVMILCVCVYKDRSLCQTFSSDDSMKWNLYLA